MYDPTLGRFLQRDPIADNIVINTYEYAADNPPNRVDPSGEDCCCVDSLDITNITAFTREPIFGHKFDVVAKLTYKPTKAFNFCDCNLKWEEKTDRPPADQNVQPNVWNDLYALYPKSRLWDKWDSRTKNPPGETVPLRDTPYIRTDGPPRTLYFRITVESAPSCDCKYTYMTVYATQELDPAALGPLRTQSFRRGLFEEGKIPQFDERATPPPPVRFPPPAGFGPNP
jgi:hypothetical protein